MTSTSRTVPEWICRTPDTAIPPRVRQKVADPQQAPAQADYEARIRAALSPASLPQNNGERTV